MYRDAVKGATYDFSSLPSPLKVMQGCVGAPGPGPLGADCRRAGSFHWLGLCSDVGEPPGLDPVHCPAVTAAAYHVAATAQAPGSCHTLGATLSEAAVEALPWNGTGVRISYWGGSPACASPAGHFNLVLTLECGDAPAVGAPGGRALDNEPVPANLWYYAHPTYMSSEWVGCGHDVKLRDPRFCPLECPRGPSGEVCGGAHAGVCEHRVGAGMRCWCFQGHSGPACGPARLPHPAPPALPPPRPAPPPPFSRVNNSACLLLDGARGRQYDLTGLPRTFNVRERDEGPVWVGRDGWHYYLTLCGPGRADCGGSPGGSAGGVSSIEQMTGVQYADHFEQHQCFSSGGDFSLNSVAYPLYEEGALGLLVRVGGGDTCGGAGFRITLLRLECDAAPPPVPHYGAFRRGLLLAGAEPTPSDIWSAVYEHAQPDREHLPGDGSCEYTIHLRGPHFCPIQCPRAANGLVCGGLLNGRCAAAGIVTQCWCFSGWGGAACDEPRGDEPPPPPSPTPPPPPEDGAGGSGGGGAGAALRGPTSGRPWLLLRFSWLREDGALSTAGSTAAFLLVVVLNAISGASVAAFAPKDASNFFKSLSGMALFAAALLLSAAAAKVVGVERVCMGTDAPGFE